MNDQRALGPREHYYGWLAGQLFLILPITTGPTGCQPMVLEMIKFLLTMCPNLANRRAVSASQNIVAPLR